jgi:cytochrome b subunit of formate dehydrogenase
VRKRKTDYGTIILHWLLVAGMGVAFLTGLRIATEAPDRSWINVFDFVLPRSVVWTAHIPAAIVLIFVSIAHAIYLAKSGLSRRVQLDKVRLRSLAGPKKVRLGAANALLTWVFFVTMVTLIVSGGSLYFGVLSGYDAVMVHWYASWVVPAFVGLHVLLHFRIGGVLQLLRIVRPQRLPPPPPRLDAIELLTLLAERTSVPTAPVRLPPERRYHDEVQARRERKKTTRQDGPKTMAVRGARK